MAKPKAESTERCCPVCGQPISQDEDVEARALRAMLVPARTGRPPKPPTPGERISLGLKVTADIKARLDAAAQESGRTQSQEAETRLQHSFDREGLLPEVLTLAYGREAAGLLMMIGLIMKTVGDEFNIRNNFADDAPSWTDNAVAVGNVAHAVLALLDAAKPQDLPVSPRVGLRVALDLVNTIYNPARRGLFTAHHQAAKQIRSLLGSTVERMLKALPRRRAPVLDSQAQARQLQISAAANALRLFLRQIEWRYEHLADLVEAPSAQELFEVLEKGLTGVPPDGEIAEIAKRYRQRVSFRFQEMETIDKDVKEQKR